jgi:hypothetical protein
MCCTRLDVTNTASATIATATAVSTRAEVKPATPASMAP